MRKPQATIKALLAALALGVVVAAMPITLSACSGGSCEAPAAEAEATTDAESTEEAVEEESEAKEETKKDASTKPENAADAGYIDQYGNITIKAIDELKSMRIDNDLEFALNVINRDGKGYFFSMDNKRWESEHGWFVMYDKNAENPRDPVGYDQIQLGAEVENGDPYIAVTAVSKADYPDAKSAYLAIAESPMDGSERSEFTDDGTWGKGIVWGSNDVYFVLVGDGGDVWHVDIIPQNALGQGLFISVTGLSNLTYVDAYTELPEGTVI